MSEPLASAESTIAPTSGLALREYRCSDPIRTAAWGLLKRKERWWLSWQGCSLAVLLVLLLVAGTWLRIHPFLAVTETVNAEYLVMEGWIPSYALKAVVEEFEAKHYQRIFVVGEPMVPDGFDIEVGDNYADHGASRLKRLGVNSNLIESVPARAVQHDRTYASALALKKWFHEHGIAPKGINVITLGTHARRSRLLNEKAFRGDVAVGVVAVENREYESGCWWKYSEGVKEVIGETIAYIYTRFFFYPSE